MRRIILVFFILISINPLSYSQISSFPYVETGEFPVGWNVIQTTPIWNFGTALVNPAGKTNDAAVVCNFFAYAAGPVGIVTSPEFNFTALKNPVVNFYTAYTTYDAQNDSLQFLVSTDAGVTFFNVPLPFRRSYNSSPSLATVPPTHTQFNPISVNQWRHETVLMLGYAGRNNIMFGFRGVCDYGNNLWLDNFIVNDADNVCQMNVTSAGSFTCGIVEINFNSIGLDKSEFTKDNPGGGVLSFAEYVNQNPVPSLANPKIAINTTSTSPDGSIFTPNKISPDKWYTVSYSGNDVRGYANYNISFDISGISGIINPDKIYIVKRADMTGSWVCLNTIRDGSLLKVNNLNTFSDFAIASDSLINPLPVELTNFSHEISGTDVILKWQTAYEINNSGFEIERKDFNSFWKKIGFVNGKGNSSVPENYSFADLKINPGKYKYRLKQIDYNGIFHYYELKKDINIGNVSRHYISQNYPNPFNPVTVLEFGIASAEGSMKFVNLKIYNLLGEEVSVLVNDRKQPGVYRIEFNGRDFPSGVYYYSLLVDGNIVDKNRMILIK